MPTKEANAMKNYDDRSPNEFAASNDALTTAQISRRTLLKTGAVSLGVIVSGAPAVRLAQAAGATDDAVAVGAGRFMAASQLLIQHQLSPGVGARLAAILHSRISTLDADLDEIIRVAQEKNAKVVEDFFDALSDQAKESAHKMIFGWYAGVVDESPSAEVVAYEEALMYQPTKDAVALPTYSLNGPNHWTDIDPPLSAMPEF
jgi:hypothetical protein